MHHVLLMCSRNYSDMVVEAISMRYGYTKGASLDVDEPDDFEIGYEIYK